MRCYGGDPKIVGRRIVLKNAEYDVIGVVSQTSPFPAFIQVFTPLQRGPEFDQVRDEFGLTVVGRLSPGTNLEAATAELAALQAGIVSRHPKTHAGRSVQPVAIAKRVSGSSDLVARYMPSTDLKPHWRCICRPAAQRDWTPPAP